ncbi:MAG: DNA gyrase inhibitor YacG, partial [Casimicrobiaceae bacterium]|nr:DNA gyrase inhibitor YacG [Casimicrobiaceae bacterium]
MEPPCASHPTISSDPFCSERCRLLDMAAWASASYRIPSP